MSKRKATTPEPVAVTTVCSVCGLGWDLHGPDPTTDDCIRLLKVELTKRSIVINPPTPYPYRPRPYQPYGPYWWGTTTVTNVNTNSSALTPRSVQSMCLPVST